MTNNTYLQSIPKGESGLYLLLTLLSMSMLITGMDTAYASPLLVLLSLPMLRRPVTLVPMLFISSWNMTFAVYGLGAYFYYFILFVIAVCFHHRQYGRYVGPKSTTLLCLLFGVSVVYGAFHSLSHETGPSVRLMFTIFSVAYASLFRCHDRHYIYSTLFSIAITASIYFGLLMLISPAQYIREDVVQEMVKVSGVSEVFNQFGRVIVMEDDLVCGRNFLSYMNQCLDFYENKKKVLSICGYSNTVKLPHNYPYDSYFCLLGTARFSVGNLEVTPGLTWSYPRANLELARG